MKKINPTKLNVVKNTIEQLHDKTQIWISEIEFVKVEQDFLKELLVEHIIELCSTNNYSNAKLLLNGIEHEEVLGQQLLNSIKEHRVNLGLLLENIYLKREDDFRENHQFLNIEVDNYFENFKYLKEQIFDLVLLIMKKEKQERLLTK